MKKSHYLLSLALMGLMAFACNSGNDSSQQEEETGRYPSKEFPGRGRR